MKRALIVSGGWEGHAPRACGEYCHELLMQAEYVVDTRDDLQAFSDFEQLLKYDLLVPNWTMGKIEQAWVENISRAVSSGVGLAGWHGGMCDAFRENTLWQFMTGGQFVDHPGGNESVYSVRYKTSASPITEGLKNFIMHSEQYYLHVDPANEVLAVVDFPNTFIGDYAANGPLEMPCAWTRRWGKGRVFYTALGHSATELRLPEVAELLRRGLRWATR